MRPDWWWKLNQSRERNGLITSLGEYPDAVIQGIESPWAADRSIVTVTFRNDDAVPAFRLRLPQVLFVGKYQRVGERPSWKRLFILSAGRQVLFRRSFAVVVACPLLAARVPLADCRAYVCSGPVCRAMDSRQARSSSSRTSGGTRSMKHGMRPVLLVVVVVSILSGPVARGGERLAILESLCRALYFAGGASDRSGSQLDDDVGGPELRDVLRAGGRRCRRCSRNCGHWTENNLAEGDLSKHLPVVELGQGRRRIVASAR